MPDQEPRVVSVNVGRVREVEWRGHLVRTGIWKEPVGPAQVRVEGVNLHGDDQADRTVHGGPDKAVYAYATEDYAHWTEVEGVAASPGLFGENLTIAGLDPQGAIVGERWRIGTVLLEVSQPRLPCYKLGIKMGDQTFLRRFLGVRRLGAYLRIIEPGDLRAGDVIGVVERPRHGMTLTRLVDALQDPSLAPSVLAVPQLPESWRRMLRDRVARGSA